MPDAIVEAAQTPQEAAENALKILKDRHGDFDKSRSSRAQ